MTKKQREIKFNKIQNKIKQNKTKQNKKLKKINKKDKNNSIPF